jgi:hypothetical protein
VPSERRLAGWARDDLAVTLSLLPDSVIEERPSWTLAVNRNQHQLGKTMLVLLRHCTSVIDIAPMSGPYCGVSCGGSCRRSTDCSVRTSSTSPFS